MTKVRLLCFSVAVLLIAAISVPAFGTTEEVALSCEGGYCTGILGTAGAVGGTGSGDAIFQVLSTFSSTGLSTEVLPELDWLSATFQTAGATFV
ncbi:MAG: hypothetical protein ACRD06_04305, partial [Terriglobia bacterium]